MSACIKLKPNKPESNPLISQKIPKNLHNLTNTVCRIFSPSPRNTKKIHRPRISAISVKPISRRNKKHITRLRARQLELIFPFLTVCRALSTAYIYTAPSPRVSSKSHHHHDAIAIRARADRASFQFRRTGEHYGIFLPTPQSKGEDTAHLGP